VSGGASKEMLDGVQDADWARDGTRMAIVRALPQYQLEFPASHMLVTINPGWFSFPRISPDQRRVAYFEHPSVGDDRGSVCVVDLDGHKQELSNGWSSLDGLAWSHDGREIWFTGSNTGNNRGLYAVTLSGHLRTVLRVPGTLVLHDIAADGRVLLAQEETRRLILGVVPGSSQERDLSWLDWSLARDLTPDGRWLLIDEQGEGGGPNYSVYVRKTDGSPAVRVGDHDAFSISDDGKWVLSANRVQGGLLVLLPTGAGEPRNLNSAGLQNPMGKFLPDGKRFLLYSDELRVFLQSLDGDARRAVTPPGVQSLGVFSADSKYVIGEDSQQKWALYPIEGGGPPVPLPKWGPGDYPINHTTDNHSFFVENGDLVINIYRFDFLSGTRTFVRRVQPPDPAGIDGITEMLMTPDGKYYVYGAPRRLSNLYVVSGLR